MKEFNAQDEIFIAENYEEILDFIAKTHQPNAPISRVRWVDMDKVQANDYNPNSVASRELDLLYTSIKEDGYTQPIVTIYDSDVEKYIIIDGFHRYFTMKSRPDLQEKYGKKLPIVVLEKDINQRMASTVRHNRARGKHSVAGMSNLVFEMLQNGIKDEEIMEKVGLQKDELLRLKHITGYSKLYEKTEYNKAFETKNQIKLRTEWKEPEDDK